MDEGAEVSEALSWHHGEGSVRRSVMVAGRKLRLGALRCVEKERAYDPAA